MYLAAFDRNRKFLRRVHHNTQCNNNNSNNKTVTLQIEHANATANSKGGVQRPLLTSTNA